MVAHILPENANMRKLADRFGFTIEPQDDPSQVVAILNL